MSAVPSEAELADPDVTPGGERPRLPRRASFFLLGLTAATAWIGAPLIEPIFEGRDVDGWRTFLILGLAAAVAQLFAVHAPPNHSYHTSVAFLSAAALLLPPPLIVLIALVHNIPEWLKERYAWYIQAFNTCNYTLNTLAAWGVNRLVLEADWLVPSNEARAAAGGLAACAAFVLLNHVLLATMLYLGRGRKLRETGLFTAESISIDLVLTALGVALAHFWLNNPWLIPIAVAPLLVVHRSLSVPQLQAQARVDPKTGLYNARYFATTLEEELSRAARFERPLSLLMVDLDLLRHINNTYGHLAGDAVLMGIADVFRAQLRHYDVPARFGGEEFSILLPETPPEQALEIAERIRRSIAATGFAVDTSCEPIHATVSVGVAAFPRDAQDANELIHEADLAVYRAKLQGRNRVLGASKERLLVPPTIARPVVIDARRGRRAPAADVRLPAPVKKGTQPATSRGDADGHVFRGLRFLTFSPRLAFLVLLVGSAGIGSGVAAIVFGGTADLYGLLAVIALVGLGQALSDEAIDQGSISVSAVGALVGAAIIGPHAALAVAITICAVEWSARRTRPRTVFFNVGALTLASLAAVAAFSLGWDSKVILAASGLAAGGAYFAASMGLLSLALAAQENEPWLAILRRRFVWLLPHYLAYGFIAGVIALAYDAVGLLALAAFALPLLLMRTTQGAYLSHTQRTATRLREAVETMQEQNVSLERMNSLLRERSTAAMESLSATVDARDSYAVGHSRRVQQLAVGIGRELGMSQAELDLLGHAALFHDIGKLAVPDAILLKPAGLDGDEWGLMQRHAAEGARIIERLGFLEDAVPAIRHHHERWDGTGYPDGLCGDEIPLGARIIHVADALDSMLTTRIYRAARPVDEALGELRQAAGTQFCPRTVAALERVLAEQRFETPGGMLAVASSSEP